MKIKITLFHLLSFIFICRTSPCHLLSRHSRPIIYYNNAFTTQKVILSGDIETNLGQTKKSNLWKHSRQRISFATCVSCKKPVHSRANRLMCSYCKTLTYLIRSKLHKILSSYRSASWICSKYYFKELLFASLRDINQVNEKDERSPTPQIPHNSSHSVKLKDYEKHLGLTHLNSPSMSLTFVEFHITAKSIWHK